VRPPRRLLPILVLAVTALAAAGCGGSQVSADEVPGQPPPLTVPSDDALDAGGGTSGSGTTTPDSSASGDTGASTDDASTSADTTADTTTGTTDTTGTDTTSGTTDTTTTDPSAGTTEPAAPDSAEAQQFEDFCAQNEGAC